MSMKLMNGFSLLELTVTMSLMGVVSLMTMRIMENQNNTKTSIESTAEINMAVSLIAQTINDTNKCGALFYNKILGSSLNGLSYTVNNPPSPPVVHQLLETRNSGKVYQHFFIDNGDITLRHDSNRGIANLDVTFRVQSFSKSQRVNLFDSLIAKTIKRTIPFNIVSDAGGRILSCGPIVSSDNLLARQNTCASLSSLGMEWNGSQCVLNPKLCPFGQLARGFDSSGNIICVQAKDQVRVEDIFDLSYVQDCNMNVEMKWMLALNPVGKIRLQCVL